MTRSRQWLLLLLLAPVLVHVGLSSKSMIGRYAEPFRSLDYFVAGFLLAYLILGLLLWRAGRRIAPYLGTVYANSVYYRRTQLARVLEGLWEHGELRPWLGTAPRDRDFVAPVDAAYHREDRRKTAQALAERRIDYPPNDFSQALERYRNELSDVIRAARERGVNVVAATQPYLFQENMPPELTGLLAHATPSGAYRPGVVAECLAEFNRAMEMEEVCAEEGVPCIELASRIPRTAEYFFEGFSPNNAGSELIAQLVAPFFMERMGTKPATHVIEN
ncbi:MAG: SGNH/GDSL hydrolase family protein [Planctomycetales bacterium]